MFLYHLFAFLLLQNNSLSDSLSVAYRQKFTTKIDSLQNSKTLENGQLSVAIKNCITGEKIIQLNGNKLVRPASTLKLITTSTALGLLGENFRYNTDLVYQGEIRNDTLIGNIIIKGSGDPTLGSWRFDETLDYSRLLLHWANDIKALNIKVINGDIVVDSKLFSDHVVPETWQWGDMGNYFGAASFGLNLNENLFKAHFKTSRKSGENTEIFKLEPFLADIELQNSVISDKNTFGDDVLFFSAPYSNSIFVTGKLPVGREDFVVKGSVQNPSILAINLLKSTLSKIGVQLKTVQNLAKNTPAKLINRVISPSLFEICSYTNYESINLFAESLLKKMATNKTNNITTADGILVLTKFWKDKGLNMSQLYMKDGSGLSNTNAISANFMVDCLTATSQQKYFTAFLQTIPILGQDGTMKNIAKNKPWAKNFSVKSGTIEKVKAFAGYFYNKNGILHSFSLMANQFEGSESSMSRELTKLFETMWLLE